MSTIKQIMIQKGLDKDSRGFSTNADNVVYNDEITELGASTVQKALEILTVKVNGKELDGENKLDKENPNGSGSLSLNRKENSTIGTNSISVGYDNIASGANSFAEGANTVASGANAHSGGSGTNAAAINSIAVGEETVAAGADAIAFGYKTKAVGNQSIAGGSQSTAAANNSIAIGNNNLVEKDGSVAIGEGLYPTLEKEIVIGAYNNENANYEDASFVVGIGTESNHKDGFIVTKTGEAIATTDVKIKSGNKTVSLNELNTKVKEGFYKELTQREYNALTEAEKNNGTVYYIKDSDPFDVAWDKVKLSRFGAEDSSIKFGVDAEGNFGYIKPGADSVIPFNRNRTGSNLLNMGAPKVGMFYGSVLDIVEVKG